MPKVWTPKPYHLEALEFGLAHPKSGLILDMGLGKTAITLAMAQCLRSAGELKHPILVSAPIRALYAVWPTEIEEWEDFNDLCYFNLHEDPELLYTETKPHIYGIAPDGLRKLCESGEIKRHKFSMLVVDESAGYKNPSTKRFKTIENLLYMFPRRHILTGSFAPNGLVDIWSQVYLYDRGESLGQKITHFRTKYCCRSEDGFGWVVPVTRRDAIYDAIAPNCIRMDKREKLHIREPIINKIIVRLPPDVMKTYKEMEREFYTVVEQEGVYSPNAGVAGGRCRQIANGALYSPVDRRTLHIHNEKTAALAELMENLQGKPLLIFYEFQHDLQRIRTILPHAPDLTGMADASRICADFNEGKIPYLLGHAASVGIALSLHKVCRDLCWFGVPWDLYVHDQAISRVWGRGDADYDVTFHYIMAERTLDFRALSILAEKRREQDDLYRAIILRQDCNTV